MPVRNTHSTVPAAMLSVIFSACLSFAGPAAMGQSANAPADKLPTLTTARQAHSLTSEEAMRAYPVHLQGVVTYFDLDFGSGFASVFLCDSSGCVYIQPSAKSIGPLPAGTVVDARGVSGPGEFGSLVLNPTVRVVGHRPLPANPPLVTMTRLLTGTDDAQWVEIEGTVHSADEYPNSVTIHVALIDGIISGTMPKEAGANYAALVDARVRVRGNEAPTVNVDSQLIGVHLKIPNLSTVTVLEKAPADPFQAPPTAINRLLRWDNFSDSFHRVHLRGNVTFQWPGLSLCIRDSTGGICMQSNQNLPFTTGELVDAIGFVGTENNEPILTNAEVKRAGPGAPVAAVPISLEQALHGTFHSQLIQIDGKLIGEDDASSDLNLMLASGNTIFSVLLPKTLLGAQTSPWKIGSKLRVTGICSVQIDVRSHLREGTMVTKSFRVLMRSPQDVAVLESPSWWTPRHILVLLALALGATLIVLGWVVILRRRVEKQTILLRESEERFRHLALHDALTGLATRLLLQDRLDVGVEAARRHKTGLALLMVDIDRFKQTNDTYGHQAGDEVLRVAAQRLLQAVRKSDTVARMGGDEFIVLLSGLRNPRMAEEIAANIVAALAVPVLFAGGQVPVSASVGVCTAFAADLDVDFLLRNSDSALYQAKAHGRNCYQVFSSEMALARIR
jgi:diguanylate cyclase (GGDEF)-like protein